MSRKRMAFVLTTVLCLIFVVSMGLSTVEAAAFAYGADVSWLPQMEAQGYVFYNDSGVQKDCLDILKEHGIDSISLRTWVNPSNDPANGHCSVSETAAMAQRCMNKGFRIMVCPHYGDTWNSVGTQNPPAAWASMSYTQMKTALANHVTDLMNQLKAKGVTPEWFKNGNEINGGICKPTGSLSNPTQMVGLLNAGYDAAKAVFPSVKVIIHVGQPQNAAAQSMLDAFKNNGGKWDIMGCSSYASLANQPGVQTAVQNLKNRYGKETMMVEVGGDYTKASEVKQTVTQWINGMKSMGGTGVFYWEPDCYNWNGYNMGAWDPNTKKPTIALDAFIHSGSTPTPTTRTGGRNNIALNKTASADSSQSANPAASGNDGSTTTRWCAANGSANHWWKVDLGSSQNITGSEVMWEKSGQVYRYKVETSTDNASWSLKVDKTNNSSTAQTQTDNFTATARYARITVTGLPSTSIWTSFFEFRVFNN